MPQEAQLPSDPSLAMEAEVPRVAYTRHEFHGRASKREDSLLALVYDIPYFGACGVFPPFQLLNQLLGTGGSQGGMSPGATWQPFSIAEKDYQALVTAVRAVPPKKLRRRARYAHLAYTWDPSFDHHQDYGEWVIAVCAKHRAGWHAALKQNGFMV